MGNIWPPIVANTQIYLIPLTWIESLDEVISWPLRLPVDQSLSIIIPYIHVYLFLNFSVVGAGILVEQFIFWRWWWYWCWYGGHSGCCYMWIHCHFWWFEVFGLDNHAVAAWLPNQGMIWSFYGRLVCSSLTSFSSSTNYIYEKNYL